MDRVFICYSRQDKTFVDQLVADLKAAGVATWRDVDDIPHHIGASTQSWRDAVQEGLELCAHMIVVVSPDSVNSAEVKAEWNYFLQHGKQVHPVFHRDCNIPYRLFALQWWDFREEYDQPFEGLLGVLPQDAKLIQVDDTDKVETARREAEKAREITPLQGMIQQPAPASPSNRLKSKQDTTFAKTAWLLIFLLSAIWAISGAICAAITDAVFDNLGLAVTPLLFTIGWATGGAIGGAICGGTFGLALQQVKTSIQRKWIITMTVGWAISWAIGGIISGPIGRAISWAIGWPIGGIIGWAIGGGITGLVLQRVEQTIRRKQIIIMIIGWAIGGSIGWAIGGASVWANSEVSYWVIGWAIGGAVGGAIGGSVILWQINQARRVEAGE